MIYVYPKNAPTTIQYCYNSPANLVGSNAREETKPRSDIVAGHARSREGNDLSTPPPHETTQHRPKAANPKTWKLRVRIAPEDWDCTVEISNARSIKDLKQALSEHADVKVIHRLCILHWGLHAGVTHSHLNRINSVINNSRTRLLQRPTTMPKCGSYSVGLS